MMLSARRHGLGHVFRILERVGLSWSSQRTHQGKPSRHSVLLALDNRRLMMVQQEFSGQSPHYLLFSYLCSFASKWYVP